MANKNPQVTGRTIQRIKDAFWQLYETKPIEKISVRQITELAGYNHATFYLYFSSVRDVRDQIEEDLLTRRDAMLDASLHDGTLEVTPELSAMTALLTRYGKVLLGPHGDPAFIERAEASAWPYIQPILFPDTPDLDAIADPQERHRLILLKHFYLSGIIGTFRAALNHPELIDPADMGRFVSQVLLPRIAPHTRTPADPPADPPGGTTAKSSAGSSAGSSGESSGESSGGSSGAVGSGTSAENHATTGADHHVGGDHPGRRGLDQSSSIDR